MKKEGNKFWRFLCLFIIFLLLRLLYRPWIYSNDYFDFHVADSFPSFFAVVIQYSFFDFIVNKYFNANINKTAVFWGIAIASYAYELLGIPYNDCDLYDCVAISLGLIVLYLFIKPLK